MDDKQADNEISIARQVAFDVARQMTKQGFSPLSIAAGLASASAQIIGAEIQKDAIDEGIASMLPIMTKDAHTAHDFLHRGVPN